MKVPLQLVDLKKLKQLHQSVCQRNKRNLSGIFSLDRRFIFTFIFVCFLFNLHNFLCNLVILAYFAFLCFV